MVWQRKGREFWSQKRTSAQPTKCNISTYAIILTVRNLAPSTASYSFAHKITGDFRPRRQPYGADVHWNIGYSDWHTHDGLHHQYACRASLPGVYAVWPGKTDVTVKTYYTVWSCYRLTQMVWAVEAEGSGALPV
jgi:hypothetical protein